ncbi:MAG: HNH endonuclease [Rhodocyclaceae bacterium]
MCKCDGCDRRAEVVSTQMCQRHNRNMRVHGTPEAPKRVQMPTAEAVAAGLARGLAKAVEVGDCLEWQGSFAAGGKTPAVKAHSLENGRTDNFPVPRLLWEREHGPIPAGKLVYRKCCNNACVLVEHLSCGTRKDWAKARRKAGASKHSATTLIALTLARRRRPDVTTTMEKARQIRSLTAAAVKVRDIAAQTGVHPDMVEDIRRGRAWRELSASPFAGLGA